MNSRNLILYFILFVHFTSCGSAQTTGLESYISGFPTLDSDEVVNFESIINQSKKMTKQEALDFVYFGDTSLLSCTQKIINMENERDFRITRDVYLPEKCFKARPNTGYMISYTSFECQDVKRPLFRTLNVLLFDESLRRTDSIVVYKADEYDFELTGLLNPKNNRIFLLGRTKSHDFHHAELLTIENGKFVLKKRSEKLLVSFDALEKYLAYLNWEL